MTTPTTAPLATRSSCRRPDDAIALLQAWLQSMDLGIDERRLIGLLQAGEPGHTDLYRRARRIHERKLAGAVDAIVSMIDGGQLDMGAAALSLFDACTPAIPYAAASAFLGREQAKVARSDGDRPRVALIADGVGGMHGVTHTLQQIRERGVRGFDVEVIGTDADVDRRLSAVAEIDVPFYRGLKIGIPGVPAIVGAVAEGRYDLVHLCAPGPSGLGAWLLARVLDLPVVGSYHTELAAYTGLRTGKAHLEALAAIALGRFYGACDVVLSPSTASDERLGQLGVAPDRVRRWDRGVDVQRFDPGLRTAGLLPGQVNVLYAGRLTKGVDLLADAFLAARNQDPRLHLVLPGSGPEQEQLRERLGAHATFLGWLGGEHLARAYASADVFAFASRTDTFGQVILEGQASGLPVVAVAEGGPASLIDHGETGLLAAPDAGAIADALLTLLGDERRRERLAATALAAVRGRTWEASLDRLSAGYRLALDLRKPGRARSVA